MRRRDFISLLGCMARAGTAAGHDLPNSVLSGGSEATYDQIWAPFDAVCVT
jgi:hypothetical protein